MSPAIGRSRLQTLLFPPMETAGLAPASHVVRDRRRLVSRFLLAEILAPPVSERERDAPGVRPAITGPRA